MNKLLTFVSQSHKWQHVAGVLLVLCVFLNTLLNITFQSVLTPFESEASYYFWMLFILPLPRSIISILATLILYPMSNNKPTKLALLLILCTYICNIIQSIMTYFAVATPNEEMALSTRIITLTLVFVVPLLCIYAYSLIIRNNSLNKTETTWFYILMICTIGSLVGQISNLIAGATDFYIVADSIHYWGYGWGIQIYNWTCVILLACFYWKFTHCTAFNTKISSEESSVSYTYSPISKYTIGGLFTLALLAITFYLIFSNAGNIISFTESIF